MGVGIDAARPDAPEHAAVLDTFKEQLLIALLRRLTKGGGQFHIAVAELDRTGEFVVAMRVDNGVFHFEVRKKQ